MEMDMRTNSYLTIVMLAFFSLSLGVAHGANGTKLTPSQFVEQVKTNNMGVQAAREESEAGAVAAGESRLLTQPELFANIGYLDSKQQVAEPIVFGSEFQAAQYQIGLRDETTFGTKVQLTTGVDYLSLTGVNPQFLPLPAFYLGGQSLQVSQSLWRNGFGSEIRAKEEAARSASKAQSLEDSYKVRVTLVTAEIDYWRLAAARQGVSIREENLERAKKLEEWNSRRARRGLGHETDRLQSEAAVKLAALDLQSAQDEERMAAWALNTDRGVNKAEVSEQLEELDIHTVDKLIAPNREGESDHLKAAEAATRAAEAKALLQIEQTRPTLDVVGAVSVNGQATNFGPAYANSFSVDHPTWAVGLRFSTPLNFGLVSSVHQAHEQERQAAELQYKQGQFEEDRAWNDLTRRFAEAKRRLALAAEIEKAQEEKYMNEKRQHSVGKTTTYQVLTFEQDYATAQLTRLKFHADLLQTIAKMKVFGGTL